MTKVSGLSWEPIDDEPDTAYRARIGAWFIEYSQAGTFTLAPVNSDVPEFTSTTSARAFSNDLTMAAKALEEMRAVDIQHTLARNLKAAMADADMDIAGLADRTEIDADKIDAILAAKDEASATDLVMFAIALDIDPGVLYPGEVIA